MLTASRLATTPIPGINTLKDPNLSSLSEFFGQRKRRSARALGTTIYVLCIHWEFSRDIYPGLICSNMITWNIKKTRSCHAMCQFLSNVHPNGIRGECLTDVGSPSHKNHRLSVWLRIVTRKYTRESLINHSIYHYINNFNAL